MAARDQEEDIVLLLSNKDFKDWVLDPSGDRHVYWTNWMKSNPDKIQAVNKAREIVRQLKFKEDLLSDQEMQLMLEKIISQEVSERAGKVIHLKRQGYMRWAKIAASFLLVISFVYTYHYFSSASDTTIAFKKIGNLKGQRTRIKLPDESIVYLNASSTLTFPESFSDSERTVELTGEAFFEVIKDPAKPFIVKSNNIKTVVLGTSFNVRSFEADSSIDVSLVAGNVKVVREYPATGKREYTLLPGEQLTYNKGDGAFEKGNFNVLDATGWKDGVLVFSNTDFSGFIEKLEQWYGVEIDVTGQPSEKWHVNGHFDNESLKEVLVGIQFVYDIDYDISGNRVTLKCN